MTSDNISVLSTILTVTLLIAGATITLVGSAGLLRLRSFYERVHAPTLGTTLGMTCIALASMIYSSALGSRPILHELLIIVFVTVTTPISLVILVGAAVSRTDVNGENASSREVGRDPG